MKCLNVRKIIAGSDADVLPEDVQAHLAHCDACREYAEGDASVRQLIALKRYEQPDPAVASRMVYSVRQQIAEESLTGDLPVGLWGRFLGFSVPTMRYALASVLMAFLAVHTLLAPSMQVVQTQLPAEIVTRVATRPTIGFSGLPTEGFEGQQVVRLASNPTPDRIQYGTRPSTVVSHRF